MGIDSSFTDMHAITFEEYHRPLVMAPKAPPSRTMLDGWGSDDWGNSSGLRSLPVRPLTEFLVIFTGQRWCFDTNLDHSGDDRPWLNMSDAAALTGVPRDSWAQWRNRNGHIPRNRADKIANHLGVHPSAIWGEWWWQLDDSSMTEGERQSHDRYLAEAAHRLNGALL